MDILLIIIFGAVLTLIATNMDSKDTTHLPPSNNKNDSIDNLNRIENYRFWSSFGKREKE